MRVDELLNVHYDELSDNEKYVCHYLAGHYDECGRKTVEEFAAACNVSKTLLIRFANHACVFYRNDFQHKISGSSKTEQNMLRIKNKISYEENLAEIKNDAPDIHKICVLGQQTAVDWLEKKLEPHVETIQKKKWGHDWYLELLPAGCNKGSAVKKLNRKLGILKKESMSFGDSENDIAMMEATGIAVAVGCGNPLVGTYASSICEPVMEDGIYKELLRRNVLHVFEKAESKN
ncbi:HMP-PP phosphatase [Eubacterium plexicaudatum ASF492]|uniref:HAD hydrolase, family IIB n=1 Tax=Eubacterium plexicaudatum ASF492 TaxID=1235802 RepID=N1ZXJ9_9FIRM|nr:HMP-PP phosphatase [Eubacterium plexicaudatum ASF492]